jgi:hypothetical protein
MAKIWILPNTGLKAGSSSWSCSQSTRRVVGATVGSTNRPLASVCTSTQSSLQPSHLLRLRAEMYLEGPLVRC